MNLSDELTWRGFANQTTYKDLSVLDGDPISFYWGVDPSADSMTIGNLATAMMVKAFIKHGHKAVLLIGGATGMIGDPDGKSDERALKSFDEINHNKQALAGEYSRIFGGQDFTTVDNYDWFKDMNYLDFLRDIGKNVPMRQMLGRDFVGTRLGEDGSGLSYAEFSYVLIQAYDFLYLHNEHKVTLQVCGSDQWGNSIAGVDLIRRKTAGEAHVYSAPLIINKTSGQKFGKSEDGAIWLDPLKTTPTQFYQFWINADDAVVEDYLKVFTELDKATVDALTAEHTENPGLRVAQKRLALEVTTLVHGEEQAKVATRVTDFLTGAKSIAEADGNTLQALRQEIAAIRSSENGSIIDALVTANLATSNSEARRLLENHAVAVNGVKAVSDKFNPDDFKEGKLLLRRGKAFKDSALVELGE